MVASEDESVRTSPHERGVVGLVVAPPRVGLRAMVSPAQRSDVAVTRRTTPRGGIDVVAVRTPSPALAPREHTRVLQQHLPLTEPVRGLVGVDMDVISQVDDRLHD